MRVVIPSLTYADYLAVMLPAWRQLLPAADIVVVTAQDDPSVLVAERAGARVIVTDVWHRKEALLNKGEALDRGFVGMAEGDPCLSIDADVYPIGRFPALSDVAADTLYGCARYEAPTAAAFHAYLSGEIELALIPPRRGGEPDVQARVTPREAARACLGYFQLFRYSRRRRFGWSKSAGKCDITFRSQFPHRVGMTRFRVVHLGAVDRRNWRGRVLPAWGAA